MCRKRGSRAGRSVRDEAAALAKPRAEPTGGEVRAGLEGWLAGFPWLPGAVVAQARVLADRLDAAPDDSPLHGRYTAVLGQLLEASREPADPDAEVARLQRELFGSV